MPHKAVDGKSAEPPDVKSGKQKASVVQAYVISTKCVAGGGRVGGVVSHFPHLLDLVYAGTHGPSPAPLRTHTLFVLCSNPLILTL